MDTSKTLEDAAMNINVVGFTLMQNGPDLLRIGATDLDDLCRQLRELDEAGKLRAVDFSHLPTFGGTEPFDRTPADGEIESWDHTRLLVFTDSGFEVVLRRDDR